VGEGTQNSDRIIIINYHYYYYYYYYVVVTVLTNRDPVSVRIVTNALEIASNDLFVLVPVASQKNALGEHPRPTDQRNQLQARLAVNLRTLRRHMHSPVLAVVAAAVAWSVAKI